MDNLPQAPVEEAARRPVATGVGQGRRAAASSAGKFCLVGAGASGLAVAKNFLEAGIPFDCLEREDEVGGNWYYGRPHSRVYRSTRLISSKRETEFSDFPMPDAWPAHPGHALVWQYLRDYARRFDLYGHIEFETAVTRIEPAKDAEGRGQGAGSGDDEGRGADETNDEARKAPLAAGRSSVAAGWDVTLASGERRRYRGVVIANGHNWDPRWPEYAGEFDGTAIHSAGYKTPEFCRGRRVLVVGGGNSGFDIAVDVAPHAAATFHSLRRGYQVLPRFFQGVPVDQCGAWMRRWRLPLWVRRWAAARTQRLAWRDVAGSLPRADHRLFETHPVINARWPHDVACGAIAVKPDVRALEGDGVVFADSTREPVDVIIYATGYKLSFPFIDREQLNWQGDRPELYLNIFHPERDDLFVAGLIQPDSGVLGLFDYQAQLIAAYVRGLEQREPAAARFQREKRMRRPRLSAGIRYIGSPRHLVEVEHHSYRRALQRWVGRLS